MTQKNPFIVRGQDGQEETNIVHIFCIFFATLDIVQWYRRKAFKG